MYSFRQTIQTFILKLKLEHSSFRNYILYMYSCILLEFYKKFKNSIN